MHFPDPLSHATNYSSHFCCQDGNFISDVGKSNVERKLSLLLHISLESEKVALIMGKLHGGDEYANIISSVH